MSSSSSTIRISDAICNPCLLIPRSFFLYFLLSRWKRQNDFGAVHAACCVLQGDIAAMVFHHLAHDRETKAGALGARGHVGLRQPVALFVRQADAIVGNADADVDLLRFERDRDAAP